MSHFNELRVARADFPLKCGATFYRDVVQFVVL
jgi:hypothetical protein